MESAKNQNVEHVEHVEHIEDLILWQCDGKTISVQNLIELAIIKIR